MTNNSRLEVQSTAVLAALERLRAMLGGALGVEFGTNVLYAKIQHFGGVIKAKHAEWLVFRIGDRWVKKKQVTIPARPYMPPLPSGDLNREDSAEVLAIVNSNLKRAFDGERIQGRAVMTDVGRYLKTSTQIRFREQKGPNKEAWKKPLRGGQALSLTRRLRNSLTYLAR
jgi:phage gpG-like protein